MTTFHDVGLSARRRALVETALQGDPPLDGELELISAMLTRSSRERFWEAFADGCEHHGRPSAAVLPALERAAAC